MLTARQQRDWIAIGRLRKYRLFFACDCCKCKRLPIHIALVGFLSVLMFKADVKAVGYAVFWGISLMWLSGLLGNAHHYFWSGTPEFWQFWGSLFSALEPLPLIFCFWHIYLDAHQDRKPIANMPAFAWRFLSSLEAHDKASQAPIPAASPSPAGAA